MPGVGPASAPGALLPALARGASPSSLDSTRLGWKVRASGQPGEPCVSAGTSQLGALCAPGTEVPPFLSLGSDLRGRPPQEGRGQETGESSVSPTSVSR